MYNKLFSINSINIFAYSFKSALFMNKIYRVLAFYTFLFSVVSVTTLSINYVEGDDASGVLYHLCGRNLAIQSPYSSYNSGLDFLLNFLNPNEVELRNFSIVISFIFSYLVLCVLAILIDMLLMSTKTNTKYWFLCLIPFIIPDFIFTGLIVNSTNISFTLVLISTIFYFKYLKLSNRWFFVLSIVFMGLSIPFRWSMIIYYPFFCSIILFNNDYSITESLKQIKPLIVFYCLSFFFGIILIYATGYGLIDFIDIVIWGKKYMDSSDKSIVSTIAVALSFFTIPLTILLFFGFKVFFANFKRHFLGKFLFLILPLTPYFILGLFIAYKYSITVIPILIFISLIGFIKIYENKYLLSFFILTIAAIWLVGIEVDVNNTIFGSGYGYKKNISTNNQIISERNLDSRLKINKILPNFDAGFYIPTPEGPRPLFGYFYVIFGGLWKKDIDKQAQVRYFVVEELIRNKNIFLMQDRQTAFLECDLYKYGYKTKSKFILNKNNTFEVRTFVNQKDTININVIAPGVSKADFSLNFLQKNKNIIFRSSYSSLIYNALSRDKSLKNLDVYTIYKKQN